MVWAEPAWPSTWREKAYVVILGRNEQKGSALVGEIKAEGGEALFLVSNVLDKSLAGAKQARDIESIWED